MNEEPTHQVPSAVQESSHSGLRLQGQSQPGGIRVTSTQGGREETGSRGQAGVEGPRDYSYQQQTRSYGGRGAHAAASGSRGRAPNTRITFTAGNGGNAVVRRNSQKLEQVQFPMKVQNLNTLVQIRKKRPKMKYSERLAFQAHKER